MLFGKANSENNYESSNANQIWKYLVMYIRFENSYEKQ